MNVTTLDLFSFWMKAAAAAAATPFSILKSYVGK
jgi:hypothetical protein